MTDQYFTSFGETLKTYRKQQKVTQRQLADRLGVHYNTIWAWERGDYLPNTRNMVLEVAMHLHLDESQTRRLLDASLMDFPLYWSIPYQHNPCFTGREELLLWLHEVFTQKKQGYLTQSCALSGLGGIGKTQVAIEYAYRYSLKHSAVLWINASTAEAMISNLMAIANALQLSSGHRQDHAKTIAAIGYWLNQHHNWLLIVDNVEDIELTKHFLPIAHNGAYLFTTRLPTLGTLASCVELGPPSLEESVHFLLRRAGLLSPQASLESLSSKELTIARTLATALDGLPLALDQAGAYIEETHSGLSDFLDLFHSHPAQVLNKRHTYAEHSLSVVETFTLAVEHLREKDSIAADLLIRCCFLAPDAIPAKLMLALLSYADEQQQKVATDPLQFDAVLMDLLSYALIQRHAQSRTFTIHHLVRTILQACQSYECSQAITTYLLHVMNQVFPAPQPNEEDWSWYKQICPHTLHVITQYKQWNEAISPDYLSLQLKLARSFFMRAQFAEAEELLQQALPLAEQVSGPEHPDSANLLSNLALVYAQQEKMKEAEAATLRAISLWERARGHKYFLLIEPLMTLGWLCSTQNRQEDADVLLQRAISIWAQNRSSHQSEMLLLLDGVITLYRKDPQNAKVEEFSHRLFAFRSQVEEEDQTKIIYS
ncbi:MAG: tetratricopeptide repeat protein [Chloroflexota bacterium]|nr:tetratricopeptide repeat protein [Chloroflexota bacterium]